MSVSARAMGFVDVPGNGIEGGSSSADGMKGEPIGIDGRPFVLDVDAESTSIDGAKALDVSCPTFGSPLASIEREMLL